MEFDPAINRFKSTPTERERLGIKKHTLSEAEAFDILVFCVKKKPEYEKRLKDLASTTYAGESGNEEIDRLTADLEVCEGIVTGVDSHFNFYADIQEI